jgi:hypothetical protein
MCELRVHVKAHVREFHADIGIQSARRNFRQQLSVKACGFAGFLLSADVLAEIVNRDAQSGSVEGLRDPQSIFDLGTGNKAAGGALANGRALGQCSQPAAFRKSYEKRP